MLKFTSIGDCCIDVYPQFNQSFLGGSAFNVCLASQKLITRASLISAVGTDAWGKKYLASLLHPELISQLPGKTSHVEINLDKHNSPSFSKWHLGVLKKFTLTPSHENFLSTQTSTHCTAIKPLKTIVKQFSEMQLPGVFKSADFDGNTPYSFSVADIPQYLPGLSLVAKSINASDSDSLAFLKNLALKHQKMVLVTFGSHGSQVFTPQKTYFQPALKTKATDTTGAGDTYLATFIISYLKTKNIPKAMLLATQAASKTITRLGASA